MDPSNAEEGEKNREIQGGRFNGAACKSDEGALWELRPKSTCIPVTQSAIIGRGTQIKIDETLKWLFGV